MAVNMMESLTVINVCNRFEASTASGNRTGRMSVLLEFGSCSGLVIAFSMNSTTQRVVQLWRRWKFGFERGGCERL